MHNQPQNILASSAFAPKIKESHRCQAMSLTQPKAGKNRGGGPEVKVIISLNHLTQILGFSGTRQAALR